jgi:hypothetical protein
MLLSGGLSSAQQTLVRYNGICTSTITSQPTGTTNLSIDINQYDTGDGVISIGSKWAREIKLGNQYCDVLIYDGGGFARLNQIPRTAAPPRKGNIFDIYG